MRTFTTLASLLLIAGLTGSAVAQAEAAAAEPAQLISRDILFGNPERALVQLSPDGQWLSFLAPVDGVLNVWVAPVEQPDAAEPITSDTDRGIRQYFWMPSGETIVYLQDRGGNENYRAYAVNVATEEETDLTPMEGVRARVVQISRDHPNELLIGLNNRNPSLHDIYLVNVETGERELVYENSEFAGFVTDDAFDVRFGAKMNPDGSVTYYTVDEAGGETEEHLTIPFEDSQTTSIIGFDHSGDTMYMIDSRGRDTAALYAIDTDTQERELVFSDPRADLSDVMVDPLTNEVEAAASNYLSVDWELFDESVRQDLNYLKSVHDGEIQVTSRTLDDSKWVVAYTDDDGPVVYYLYDSQAGEAEKLFSNRPELEDQPLAPMHAMLIETRDGLKMPSYLTLPPWTDVDGDGRPNQPLPMVLFVHGGPWARDAWGYNPYHQWLANRGYAVLSPNFRGSSGFGKSFLNAGNKEWADAMHTDLLDAVQWAVDNGIALEDRVAIMGGSYGGYAALAGLTYSPEVFAAAVDIVGPSNLITLLEAVPPYWEPMIAIFTQRVGDHRTPQGRRQLRDMSPLTHVSEITKPLLIGQGANDPRVKRAESDQIVRAMQAKGLPVTYVLFPDEGHGFAKPENRKAFNAVAEVFLAKHIGGRLEPIEGELAESSALLLSKGNLELPIEEAEWDANGGEGSAAMGDEAAAGGDDAAATAAAATIAYEDLTAEQQAAVDATLQQFQQIPKDELPMIIAQLETRVSMMPEDRQPAALYLLQELRKMSEAEEETEE